MFRRSPIFIKVFMANDFRKKQLIQKIISKPSNFGKFISKDYNFLEDYHGKWIQELLFGKDKEVVLFAYRNSGKSQSIGIIGVLLYLLLYPKNSVFLYTQAHDTAKERVNLITNLINTNEFKSIWQILYGNTGIIGNRTETYIDFVNKGNRIDRTLKCLGILSRQKTGTHPDLIILDDIVDAEHMVSEVKRKGVNDRVNELRRTLSDKGRMISIATPYHIFDANQTFDKKKYYPIDKKRSEREYNLYEKHIKTLPDHEFKSQYLLEFSDLSLPPFNFTYYEKDVFKNDPYKKVFHLDISGEGKDYTALTGVVKHDGNFIVYGRLFRNFIDNVKDIYEIVGDNTLYVEKNRNETSIFGLIRDDYPFKVRFYPEAKNKHLKILNLTKYKNNMFFDKETSTDYKEQINKYTEKAINDDAPDSLSSIMTYFEKYVPEYRANTEFLKDSKAYENYLQKQFVNNYTF